jgi:pilus assembly protein CpaF
MQDLAMQLPSKLQELIEDPSVRDVVISGGHCGVDRGNGILEIANPFTPEELEGELRQLAFEAGVRCDIARPAADIALDRYRIHAVLPYGISTTSHLSLRVHPEVRTQLIADLAALAAADTMTGIIAGVPCENAREIALGNGASLESCRIVSQVVSVRVGKEHLVFEVVASADARALGSM